MHILLQGPAAGAYAMIAAVLYGFIVVYGPRSIVAVFLVVAVAFVI